MLACTVSSAAAASALATFFRHLFPPHFFALLYAEGLNVLHSVPHLVGGRSIARAVDRRIAQAVHDPGRGAFDVEERAVQELEEPHWAHVQTSGDDELKRFLVVALCLSAHVFV